MSPPSVETSDSTPLYQALRDLLAARSALVTATSPLPDDLPLDAGGLGLDSIALAELVLEGEERFGLASALEILAGPPLTVGGLLAHLRADLRLSRARRGFDLLERAIRPLAVGSPGLAHGLAGALGACRNRLSLR